MKKNIIYISIMILLLGIAVFLVKKPARTTEVFNKDMLKADSLKVIEIIYQQNGIKISLAKGLNNWHLKEPEILDVDNNVRNTMLQFVNNITLKNIISEKSEKFSKFGVDSTGIVLTVRKEDNSKISYIIGSDDQERNYSFYRREGEDKIYLGTLFPRYRLTPNVEDWKKKADNEKKL